MTLCFNSDDSAYLCYRWLFIRLKKANLTQTLNVGMNSPTAENAYTETRKYLLLWLDLNTNSQDSSKSKI